MSRIRNEANSAERKADAPVRRRWINLHPRRATLAGSAIGGAIVLAAAGALGAGVVSFGMSIAVGMVLGGWAGGEFSQRRARARGPREAVRRRRSIRIFRITRTMRRRRLGSSPVHRAARTSSRLVKPAG
jgi:hypothetical protein